MGEQFRRLIEEELSTQRPPPLDGLVDRAVVDGRRMRRARAFRTGSVAAAVVLVLVGGAAMAGQGVWTDGPPGMLATATAGPQRAPATPAGMVELLTRLLPAAETSGHAGQVGEGRVWAQVYVDRGNGPRLVRISVSQRPEPPPTECASDSARPLDTTNPSAPPSIQPDPSSTGPSDRPTPLDPLVPGLCQRQPDGSYLRRFERPDDCTERTGYDLYRPDGASVRISIAQCTLPAAVSDSEAIAIVTDHRWGPFLPADIVTAGDTRFPNLPEIGEAAPR